jgi:hypothetical protein
LGTINELLVIRTTMPRAAISPEIAASPLVRTGIDWFNVQDPVAVRVWLFGLIALVGLTVCFYFLFIAQRRAKQPEASVKVN